MLCMDNNMTPVFPVSTHIPNNYNLICDKFNETFYYWKTQNSSHLLSQNCNLKEVMPKAVPSRNMTLTTQP